MKKDVFISIKGIQRVEGDEEVIELMTVGNLYKKRDSYYLTYDETEATGFSGSRTTLKLDREGRVTLQRSNPHQSHMIVEAGRRHQCHYDTAFGDMFIGVLGVDVSSTLTEEGGELEFRYSLDINTELASENEVHINVREM